MNAVIVEAAEDGNLNEHLEETTLNEHDTAELDRDVDHPDGNIHDVIERTEVVQKRKIKNQIPHLIDSERKHLGKALSAANS